MVEGPRSRLPSAPVAHNLCLYQASSKGDGCNLARFGSPEPGLGLTYMNTINASKVIMSYNLSSNCCAAVAMHQSSIGFVLCSVQSSFKTGIRPWCGRPGNGGLSNNISLGNSNKNDLNWQHHRGHVVDGCACQLQMTGWNVQICKIQMFIFTFGFDGKGVIKGIQTSIIIGQEVLEIAFVIFSKFVKISSFGRQQERI